MDQRRRLGKVPKNRDSCDYPKESSGSRRTKDSDCLHSSYMSLLVSPTISEGYSKRVKWHCKTPSKTYKTTTDRFFRTWNSPRKSISYELTRPGGPKCWGPYFLWRSNTLDSRIISPPPWPLLPRHVRHRLKPCRRVLTICSQSPVFDQSWTKSIKIKSINFKVEVINKR